MKKYKHFGVMIDCSRNAVKTVEELKRFINNIAKMGYNTVELYTEDTYKIPTEPYFGYLRGGYSAEEIREIDAYCKTKGVELIPCIQTLAHLTNTLKLPQYFDVWDTGDILLIDEPKTYVLIEKMFKFCSENFTSREINIGFDEANMVGFGQYYRKHGLPNRQEILLRHLNKVVEIARKYGFKPHMWGDMFFRMERHDYYCDKVVEFSQSVVDKIPEDISLVYWDYYTEEKKIYDVMFQSYKNLKENIWFAGGSWVWSGFAPFNEFTLHVSKPAMESVIDNDIDNVLITLWGDNGAECSTNCSLASLFAIKMYADGVFDMEIIKEKFFDMFGIKFDNFMLLDKVNDTKKNREEFFRENPARTLFYNDCFLGKSDADLENKEKLEFKTVAEQLKKAGEESGEFQYIFETLSSLASFLDVKAYLGIETRKAYQLNDKEALKKLLEKYQLALRKLDDFYSKLKISWFKENKPFGWEVQDIRLGGLARRIECCKKRIMEYCEGTIFSIPELEEQILPFEGHLRRNLYEEAITGNVF